MVVLVVTAAIPWTVESASASGPPSLLAFDHSGTACASVSGHSLSTTPKMSQTGIAFVSGELLISCWGDTTIAAISPLDGHEITVYHIAASPYVAFGALAYDSTDGRLYACASTNNAGTGNPENKMSEVGIINLATQAFTPEFNSNGCDNGLAWDAGTTPARQDTLWTSSDLATTIYDYPLSGGSPRESDNIASLMGPTPANSGIAIGDGKFYLANPQTTTKRVYSLTADLAHYADPTEPVISSAHRYEDLECDDQTYAPQTVIWIMWFNQNILDPMPITGTCAATTTPNRGSGHHSSHHPPR
jgi:hypothetical protein